MPASRAPSVSRTTLARQVYDLLLARIRSGELKLGQRLIEADIAAEVGTSRGPVREAIMLLRTDGWVVADDFSGARIVDPHPSELADTYRLRAVLEGYAAALLTAHVADLAPLYAITDEMRRTAGQGATGRLRELDGVFHETLVELANQGELIGLWNQMRTKIEIYMVSAEAVYQDASGLAASHELLLKAIETGDPQRAEQRVRSQLIASAEKWTKRTDAERQREGATARE